MLACSTLTPSSGCTVGPVLGYHLFAHFDNVDKRNRAPVACSSRHSQPGKPDGQIGVSSSRVNRLGGLAARSHSMASLAPGLLQDQHRQVPARGPSCIIVSMHGNSYSTLQEPLWERPQPYTVHPVSLKECRFAQDATALGITSVL